MKPTITAFERSPDRGRGLARDMPVRWALEEVGQSYHVCLLPFDAMKQPPHLARQPFGQIPTYEEQDLVLFESGAILLHIAQQHAGLLPGDMVGRARAAMWIFAAQTTIEPPIFEHSMALLFDRGKPWHDERLALLERRVDDRLEQLSAHLGDAPWLEADFSVGDLAMVSVLRRLSGANSLARHPILAAYVARGEARPAFQRAFAAQLAVFNQAPD